LGEVIGSAWRTLSRTSAFLGITSADGRRMTSRRFTKGLSDAIVATEIVAVLSRADNNNRALLVPDPLDRS
jgi:hypothetical protein